MSDLLATRPEQQFCSKCKCQREYKVNGKYRKSRSWDTYKMCYRCAKAVNAYRVKPPNRCNKRVYDSGGFYAPRPKRTYPGFKMLANTRGRKFELMVERRLKEIYG